MIIFTNFSLLIIHICSWKFLSETFFQAPGVLSKVCKLAKIAAWYRCWLPIKKLFEHTTIVSFFCVFLVWIRNLPNDYKHIWMWPKLKVHFFLLQNFNMMILYNELGGFWGKKKHVMPTPPLPFYLVSHTTFFTELFIPMYYKLCGI